MPGCICYCSDATFTFVSHAPRNVSYTFLAELFGAPLVEAGTTPYLSQRGHLLEVRCILGNLATLRMSDHCG